MDTLGLVHTPGVGTTQVGLDFSSGCKLSDGTVLAGGAGGLVSLDSSISDNNTNIFAFVEFPRSDLGISKQKRVRKAILGFETSDTIIIKFRDNEGPWSPRTVTPIEGLQQQEGLVVDVGRAMKGRYFEVRVENFKGADFSLDSIDLMVTILTKQATE